ETVAATGAGDRAAAAASAVAAAAEAHQESLRHAAAESEAALRERMRAQLEMVAELPVAATEADDAASRVGPPSRFARMGIVEGDTSAHLDLDAVLARRRAV
ncbi:MAG: hypothetical protein Q7T71_12795, partial [Herbiconiux sp.]|nr:hypothetical protein [Herbiconiux sp.]